MLVSGRVDLEVERPNDGVNCQPVWKNCVARLFRSSSQQKIPVKPPETSESGSPPVPAIDTTGEGQRFTKHLVPNPSPSSTSTKTAKRRSNGMQANVLISARRTVASGAPQKSTYIFLKMKPGSLLENPKNGPQLYMLFFSST